MWQLKITQANRPLGHATIVSVSEIPQLLDCNRRDEKKAVKIATAWCKKIHSDTHPLKTAMLEFGSDGREVRTKIWPPA